VTSGREVDLFHRPSASSPGQKSTSLSAESAAPESTSPTGAEAAIYPRFGYQLLLDRSSLVDRVVIESGSWERKQLDFLLRLANHLSDQGNAVFLDIGAYWGLYSLLMAQSGFFERICAFEADAHNFAQLQANLFLNKATHRIDAFYKAVTDKNQAMYAWDSLSHPDGNRGGVKMVGRHDSRPSMQIEGITIDSFLDLQDANLVIKIDGEGHEQHVRIGMEETLRGNRVIMQVEIS
jgi:FkbM family methyltransferase